MNSVAMIQKNIRHAVSTITGHHPDDIESDMFLESDLGVDSIKMVELVQSLMGIVPDEFKNRFADNVPLDQLMHLQSIAEIEDLFSRYLLAENASQLSATEPALSIVKPEMAPADSLHTSTPVITKFSSSGLEEKLFNLISNITGHEAADLELDLFLESDLGIDSIKMVELSQSLLGLVPEKQQETFLNQTPADQMMHLQSLREIFDLLLPFQDEGALAKNNAPSPVRFENLLHSQPSTDISTELVEILPSQYVFLVSHWVVSTCSLCSHVRVKGSLDIAVVRQCWSKLLERHPALRSHFVIPAQATSFKDYRYEIPSSVNTPEIEVRDLSTLSPAQQTKKITDEVERRINYHWDLNSLLLHSFFVFKLSNDVHEIFFTNHHLISDGLGNQQVVREFLKIYAAYATGLVPALAPATSINDYRHLAQVINQWHSREEDEALNAMLRRQGKQSFVWNPSGSARATAKAKCRNYRFQLDGPTTEKLLRLTGELRASMNAFLVSAYLRTVSSFVDTNQPIFLNIPTSGRLYGDVDATGVVGCFAQNLALDFARPTAEESWAELVGRVNTTIEDGIASGCDRAQTRQAAIAIRDRMQLKEGAIPESHGNLIRMGMKSNLFLPYIGHTHLDDVYGPLQLVDYQAATVTNAGTLDTVIEVFHGRLEMTTNYDANHYSQDFVSAVADELLRQLKSLANTQINTIHQKASAKNYSMDDAAALLSLASQVMGRPLGQQDLVRDLEAELGLDSLERIRIISRLLTQAGGNYDRRALMASRTLGDMLAITGSAQVGGITASNEVIPYLQIIHQCKKTPDTIAVYTPESSMTYGELHKASNQMAHWLRLQSIGRGDFVAVMLQRGPAMITSLLGILKAGAAYIPLDPDYPAARLSYMLTHSRVETLITDVSHKSLIEECAAHSTHLRNILLTDNNLIALNTRCTVTDNQALKMCSIQDLPVVNQPEDPMVVLYTSGSTGKPKGVVLAHRGYTNRHQWHQALFALQPGERVAQKTSVCFDISVWEIFWTLQFGGTICPVSTRLLRDPWALSQWIRETRINVMHFVPSLFGEFLEAVEPMTTAYPELRHIIFSGEALPVILVQRWLSRFGMGTKLTNLYGPTEASIDVTAWQIDSIPPLSQKRIPIGFAMPNVYLLVLDEDMKPVSQGEMGHLWIGGMQLAIGYLHDDEKTNEAFCLNPFGQVPGSRIYKTGDLVVQLPDGSYDYRGRADSQVKIRGYRVELGEIEAVLLQHPMIREAAVIAPDQGDGHLRLECWLAGKNITDAEIKTFLAEKLPGYMVPRSFSWLESLPKNQNGKLDRKALATSGEATNPMISGHDISVIPTEEAAVTSALTYPLSPAQHWLVSYFDEPYLWAGFSRFRYLHVLDMNTFNKALNLLTQKHIALRSVFSHKGDQWHQHFPAPAIPPQAEYYDGSHLSAQARDEQIKSLIVQRVKELNLNSQKLLWNIIVVKEAESRYDICVVGHHIISDMLGNGILFKSLWQLYSECLSGNANPVQEEKNSFIAYLNSLEQLQTREAKANYINYWTTQFPASMPAFRVPVDMQQGNNTEASSASESFHLNTNDIHALQGLRQQHNCSLYTLLLAPLYYELATWSGNTKVVVSHRTHGRDLGNSNTYFDCVGNFAINYPLAITVNPASAEWTTIIASIRNGFETVPLNGVSYDLVAKNLPSSSYPDDRLTPVRANYLGDRRLPQSRVFEFDESNWDQRFSLPEQKRSAQIEVFFIANDGKFKIEFSYSRNIHHAHTIRQLGERYLGALRQMVSMATIPAAIPPVPPAKVPAIAQVDTALRSPIAGKLSGKIAVVTGAGRGIGRTISAILAREGATVVLVSRSPQQLDEALREVRDICSDAISICADVTQADAVERMVDKVVAQFGKIDILINNAGANRSAILSESDPKEWRDIVDINLMSTFYCCRFVVPHMQKNGSGKIVNIGSVASVIGYPLFSAYSASKHAVLGLTKALAEEVKKNNIQVNVICPAFVDTRMTPQAFRSISMPTEQVANVVLFLSSTDSDGITGESINVFGKQDMYAYGSDKLKIVKAMTSDFRPGVPV